MVNTGPCGTRRSPADSPAQVLLEWKLEGTSAAPGASAFAEFAGASDITGLLDIGGLAQTSSRVPVPEVPEPGLFAMTLASLGLLGFSARRRSRLTA